MYIKLNDEFDFARALAEFMDDPVRRNAMGLLGRMRVETELASQFSVPKFLEVCGNILSSPLEL